MSQILQPNDAVLLVTHGDIGKMIYAAYHGIDWKIALNQFHFANTDVVKLDPILKCQNALIITAKQADSQ